MRLCRRTAARAVVAVRGSTVTHAQAELENIGAAALNSDAHVRSEVADGDQFLRFSLVSKWTFEMLECFLDVMCFDDTSST